MNLCFNRLHCVLCRTDLAWRESLKAAGLVKDVNFNCPYGVTSVTAMAVQGNAFLERKDMESAKSTVKQVRQRKGTCCGQSEEEIDVPKVNT